MYPTKPMNLDEEVKVGEGRVRYPEFVKRLHEIGFEGEFIIEREISGDWSKNPCDYEDGMVSLQLTLACDGALV